MGEDSKGDEKESKIYLHLGRFVVLLDQSQNSPPLGRRGHLYNITPLPHSERLATKKLKWGHTPQTVKKKNNTRRGTRVPDQCLKLVDMMDSASLWLTVTLNVVF